jgi:hypothetical protein
MSSSILRAPRRGVVMAATLLAVTLLMAAGLRASPVSGEAAPPDARRADRPVITLELATGRDALDELVVSNSLTFAAPDPEEKPIEVPLPPALGTGLAGLGAMAALRAGHRVYRRRRTGR